MKRQKPQWLLLPVNAKRYKKTGRDGELGYHGIGLNGRNIIGKELCEQCANEGRKRMFPKHDWLSLLIEKNCS